MHRSRLSLDFPDFTQKLLREGKVMLYARGVQWLAFQ